MTKCLCDTFYSLLYLWKKAAMFVRIPDRETVQPPSCILKTKDNERVICVNELSDL